MYPTIYHALKDLIGLDLPVLKFLNSFGFFVVLAFIAAAYTLSLEIKRRTAEGAITPVKNKVIRGQKPSLLSYLSSGVIGFLLGFKFIHAFLDGSVLSDPPRFLLSSEGNLIGGLVVAALFLWLRYREYSKEREQFPQAKEVEYIVSAREHANNVAVQGAIWGFIGAKLFFMIEDPENLSNFLADPSIDSILSGLTVYGGLILGTFGVLRYFRKNGIPILVGADSTAPGFMLAYGIGRIGCQVAGDGDWGIANTSPKPDWLSWIPDWAWAYDYPNNVNGVGVPLEEGATIFEGYGTHLVPEVWPTPIYEILMAVVIFGILWKLRSKLTVPGAIFFLMLAFNGVERWFIEKIRVNEKLDFLGLTLTQAEYISIGIFLVGLLGLFTVYRRNNAQA